MLQVRAHFDNLKITIASTGDDSIGWHNETTTEVALKFSGDFSFSGVPVNEIKPGDYFIVKAPDNLNLEDRTMDLIDTNSNTKMGTVKVEKDKHQLLFTFNEAVKDKQNIRGNFVATAKETVTKEEKKVTYKIPGGKTQEITFKTRPFNVAPVEGELIYKGGWNHGSLPQIGWNMRINRSKQNMDGHAVKIKDNLSLGAFATYIESTFDLWEVEYISTNTNEPGVKNQIKQYRVTTDPEEYKKDTDNSALLTFTNGKRSYELLMPTNMGNKSFLLEYRTTSPADTSEVKNSAQYWIDNEPQLTWKKWGEKVNESKEYSLTMKSVKSAGATVTADIAGKIKITKFDEADAGVKLAGVVFEILRKSDRSKVQEVTTDENGIALTKALSDGKYIVKEKSPKSG
ncbi:Ig-like domain-containing protein, partial [Streptococcus constellatus]|uniref:Ig-like domain-containing protein n=1 Tax=Streptococcus constellatus TaxID=76860 RepID=UPI0021B28824